MGYIFDVDDETVWSPSLSTGRLYVGMTNCIAEIEGCGTGLSAIADDMYEIDLSDFRGLVERVYKSYCSTRNHIYRGQLHGWLLTSLVLLKRSGVSIETTPGDADESLWGQIDRYEKAMPT